MYGAMQINRKGGELALQGAEGGPPGAFRPQTLEVASPALVGTRGRGGVRGNARVRLARGDSLLTPFSPLVSSHREGETHPGNCAVPPGPEVSGKDTDGGAPCPEDSLCSSQARRPVGHCQRDLIQKRPRRSAQNGPEEGRSLAVCCVSTAPA